LFSHVICKNHTKPPYIYHLLISKCKTSELMSVRLIVFKSCIEKLIKWHSFGVSFFPHYLVVFYCNLKSNIIIFLMCVCLRIWHQNQNKKIIVQNIIKQNLKDMTSIPTLWLNWELSPGHCRRSWKPLCSYTLWFAILLLLCSTTTNINYQCKHRKLFLNS